MNRRDSLERRGQSGLEITLPFLEGEFNPRNPDLAAARELCVELLTRITNQNLAPEDCDEKTTLARVYALFGLPRETLRRHASGWGELAILPSQGRSQIVLPFTAKSHLLSLAGALQKPERGQESHAELKVLQARLRGYARALAEMAQVEDLTHLEADSG